jgi:hypothetical protein
MTVNMSADIMLAVIGSAVNELTVNGSAVCQQFSSQWVGSWLAVNGLAVEGMTVNMSAVNRLAVVGSAVNGLTVNGSAVNGFEVGRQSMGWQLIG